MIDLKLLESRGLTHDNLKTWLSKDLVKYQDSHGYPPNDPTTDEGRRARLVDRIRMRIQEGRNKNLENFKVWAAINEVWDTPFRQINPTLAQSLLDKDPDGAGVKDLLNKYGVNDILDVVDDPKSAGKKVRRFNRPAFWQVLVPLARSVTTVRWAKIVNDRRLTPFLKFEPSVSTKINRLRCEILTNRIEVMSRQYGYFTAFKQSTLYMLKYGIAVEIPEEEWHHELQEVTDESMARTVDGEVMKDEDTGRMTQVIREGIRYYHPHPSRMFWDMSHPPSSFLTDSGCDFFGCWKITRYRDIRYNKKFWNVDSVSVGTNDMWWTGANAFFEAVYGNCTMAFPNFNVQDDNDRETQLAWNIYTQQHDDHSVQVTEYYEKLVPKDNGLGDYEYPVWFRFVVAGTDTILYAAPLPYCPVLYAGYDSDEYQGRNSSMVLEAMPFQNQFENVLSQHLYSLRQNLMNISFVDEEAISPGWMEKIRNLGEKAIRGITMIPYSSKLWSRKQLKPENVVQNFKFPQLNTQESISALKLILDILERVLVMSSQEMAQSASHEQTREEVRNIASTTSQRLAFTATPIDQMLEAKKIQIYQGLMAYGEDEFYAQIPSEDYVTLETLSELGFTADASVEEQLMASKSGDPRYQNAMALKVNKAKLAIPLTMFSANRDGSDRINNSEGGAAMLQFVAQATANPNWVTAAGMSQLMDLTNMALQIMGFPRDFRMKFTGQSPDQQQQEMQQMVGEIMKQVEQQVKPIGDAVEKNSEALGKLAQEVEMMSHPEGESVVQ